MKDIKLLIENDVVKKIKGYSEKDLPQKSQDLIKEIKEIHGEITLNNINVEQKLILDNIYQKRFPQVIEEYILISPRYKEKLKGSDFDPDKLLFESLHEIKQKINETFELTQEQHLHKLKVTHKYLGG